MSPLLPPRNIVFAGGFSEESLRAPMTGRGYGSIADVGILMRLSKMRLSLSLAQASASSSIDSAGRAIKGFLQYRIRMRILDNACSCASTLM
jgi:hypothetical protein